MIESAQVENPVAAATIREPERKTEAAPRLLSLDAFRGLVMTLMLAESMRLPVVARAFPHSAIWALIAYNTEHVDWQGCSLHDLIQPAFSFLVGAALPFSIASRTVEGTNLRTNAGHAFRRASSSSFSGSFCGHCIRTRPTHFRRHADPDRVGLRLLVSARIRARAHPSHRAGVS